MEDITIDSIIPEIDDLNEPGPTTAERAAAGIRMKFAPREHQPEYARHCDESGHWCKPPVNYGGCIKCQSGWFYGKSVGCADSYTGSPCDFGPYDCGGKPVCMAKGIEAGASADKSLILTAMHLSNIIYETGGPVAEEKACTGITQKLPLIHKTFAGHDTRVAWGVAHGSYGQLNGEKLYTMAFRGTVSATNWLTNFKLVTHDINLKDGTRMSVHKGFHDALEPHKAELLSVLEKMMADHKRLLVTGHSLGGALATLFALYVAEAFPDLKVELITVGSPRVGDATFAEAVEAKTNLIYRVAARCDPVANTPSSLWDSFTSPTRWVMHAGPQITVGAQYACVSQERITAYISGAAHGTHLYINRILKYIRGGHDTSLCRHGGSFSNTTNSKDDLFDFEAALP